MKHLPKILFLALLCIACRDEHDVPTHDFTIGFKAGVENTRAVADISSLQTSGFSVWGGYDKNNVFKGEKVEYKNYAWSYGEPKAWVLNKTYNFYALYPSAIGTSNEDGSFTIQNFDLKTNTSYNKTATERIDLLRASVLNMDSNNPETVNLTFNHMFSEIEVYGMIDQAALTAGANVQVSDISIYGIPSVASYTDLTNTWETNTRSDKGEPFFQKEQTPTLTLTTTAQNMLGNSLWVAPVLDNNCIIQISYSFNDVSQTKEIRPLAYTDGGWQAGKRYRYTFSVTDDGSILFETPKIAPWANANGSIIIIN